MKKQILMAVGASALVATSAFAEISITGDSLFRVSNVAYNAGDIKTTVNKNEQRVRLHFTGKAGKTSVHMTVRSDGRSRASGGAQQGGSNGATSVGSAQLNVDSLYVKTSIDKVNIQAGDWWWTTGFGLVQKGKGTGDRVQLSTTTNGWKIIGGYNTNATEKGLVNKGTSKDIFDKDTTKLEDFANSTKRKNGIFYLAAKGKIKGWNVGFKHTADTISQTKGAIGTGKDAKVKVDVHDNSFIDITVKGSVKGIHIATEWFKSSIGESRADAFLLHVNKKIKGINLHFATAYYGAYNQAFYGANSKFSPLGVSFIGKANGVNGGLALANVNDNTWGLDAVDSSTLYLGNVDTSFVGFRADFKAKGMDIKVALGDFDTNQNDKTYVASVGKEKCKNTVFCDKSSTFLDLSVTYPLSKGATLKGTYGSWAGQTSMGAKISMKF